MPKIQQLLKLQTTILVHVQGVLNVCFFSVKLDVDINDKN